MPGKVVGAESPSELGDVIRRRQCQAVWETQGPRSRVAETSSIAGVGRLCRPLSLHSIAADQLSLVRHWGGGIHILKTSARASMKGALHSW